MVWRDARGFRRVAAGARVRCTEAQLDRRSRAYLEGLTANVSISGLFIASERPYAEGTVLELELDIGEPGADPVHGRGIVRWRRRLGHPRGMGVELIELDGLGRQTLEAWVERLLTEELVAVP